MVVHRSLPTFLSEPRRIEVAAEYAGRGEIATVRYELGRVDSYGTTVEAPERAPVPGRVMSLEVSTFGPDAIRLRFHRGAEPIDPLVLPGGGQPVAADAAGALTDVVIDPEPFIVSAARGRLRSRPHDLESLRRMHVDAATWPAHEQRWQVMNRFAYPVGCTVDEGPEVWFASFELGSDEQIFGLGEDYGALSKRGTRHDLWSQEAFANCSPAVYKPVPFWWSTAGYGLLVNTTNPVRVDVGAADHTAISVAVEGAEQLDLVVIEGNTPADILATYGRLTGTPRVPPDWTFGVWMGRISYRTQDEVETVAAEMHARDIPCDVIHLDTHWFAEDWNCDYRFCPDRFPDPGGMIERLRELGIRVSLWQWPNVLADSTIFRECVERGLVAIDPTTGGPFMQDGFVGPAGVLDYSNPDTVAWIAERLRPLLELGVACITTDFGEGAPIEAAYAHIDSMAMHNAYPLLYNDAVMAVSQEVHGDDAVVWSRSGWAGSQCYPIHWSGDGVARWQDMACVVRAMLSMGLSGIPFYAHDVGGFSGVPDPDLYVRWTQLGVCSSHLRFHGFPPREPWAFGPAVETIVRDLLHLRKRLQPYLVEQAAEAVTGAPLCRAMVFADPHDPTCAFVEDQYLLGDDLLVAPILHGSGRRRVYVPRGDWLDWWTGDRMPIGWQEVEMPLERFPLYVRDGAEVASVRG